MLTVAHQSKRSVLWQIGAPEGAQGHKRRRRRRRTQRPTCVYLNLLLPLCSVYCKVVNGFMVRGSVFALWLDALILYGILSKFDPKEIDNFFNGTNISLEDQPLSALEELLLIYIMALNHPAFNYEQKSKFGNIFLRLQEEEIRLNIPKVKKLFLLVFHKEIVISKILYYMLNLFLQTGPIGMNVNDRLDSDVTNDVVAPPPIQAYQGNSYLKNILYLDVFFPVLDYYNRYITSSIKQLKRLFFYFFL